MRSNLFYPALLALIVLSACREDSIVTDTVNGAIPTPTTVTQTAAPITIDRAPESLRNVTFSGISSAATINPDGSVTIPAGSLDPNGSPVTLTKPGFWPEHRLLTPAGSGDLRETFIMEPKVKAGQINPTDGGTIDLGDNFSVTLVANTVVTTEDGAAYDGPVEVYVNHDAPEDAREMLNSPINYPARLADGSSAALESYGMMDIALEAPDGTPLRLGDDTKAEVRMPLKAAAEASGPDVVDFWVLSPDGFWLKEGIATLAPGCYVVYIQVSATYNVDVPHPVTQICGRLLDPNGLPLTHSPFLVSLEGGMNCSAALVDCDGRFCVDVAAEAPLRILVTDPCTDEITAAFEIDPVDPNTSRDVGDLKADLANPVFVATVRDCGGNALPDIATTEIWVGGNGGTNGEYFAPDSQGTTVVNVIDCSGDDLLIQSFTTDYRAASRVTRRTAQADAPAEFIVCGELAASEYFDVTIGDVAIPITEVAPIYWPDNEGYDWVVRAAGTLDGEEYSLFLQFAGPHQGAFDAAEASAAIYRLLPGQDYGEGKVYVAPSRDIGLQGTEFTDEEMVFEGSFDVKMNLQDEVAQDVEATDVDVQVAFRLEL